MQSFFINEGNFSTSRSKSRTEIVHPRHEHCQSVARGRCANTETIRSPSVYVKYPKSLDVPTDTRDVGVFEKVWILRAMESAEKK